MKVMTIARATALQAIRQPVFLVLLGFATLLLIVTVLLPYFTFGEDIKMYKDTGLTAITSFTLLLALLTSSSAVAEEIEGKTAVTLLSKPVNRREFIIGKFLGIELAVLALFLVLGALFAYGVWFKYEYDLREGAGGTIDTAQRIAQVRQILPGLVLGFCEVTVITAISVAISTRLPILVNLIVCLSIYLLGHLTEVLVNQAEALGANPLVEFMAKLFQWALPFLEFFNAGPAISTGVVIPWAAYVLPAVGYCVMYSGAALLLALLLFETRDVA